MARIHKQNDSLIEMIDFLEALPNRPCQPALDYLRTLGDITLGEWVAQIKVDTDIFLPEWVAYSVLIFPKYLNKKLMDDLTGMAESNPKTKRMLAQSRRSKGKTMEIEDNA